ncbi:hypothetical protein WKH32_04175 [Pantoea agglomerans]|uniref:hypothetical protein n=1 Tax=Enterobacter agglomerans TaxID=549 RepID=UPI003C7AE159
MNEYVFINFNVGHKSIIACIGSNENSFLSLISDAFSSQIVSYSHNVDVKINASFDISLTHFNSAFNDYKSARCGLLVNSFKNDMHFEILSLFNSNELHKAAFREIRDFIECLLQKESVLTLHSACVSNKDGAICIIGDKFAGKSTLMLKALSLGYDFVSNDKPFLYLMNSSFYAFSLPVSAGIRYGSISMFPDLEYAIKKQVFSEHVEFSTNGRVHLTPRALCEVFNIDYVNNVKIKKFIFLSTSYSNKSNFKSSSRSIERNILFCNDRNLFDALMASSIIFCKSYEEAVIELER